MTDKVICHFSPKPFLCTRTRRLGSVELLRKKMAEKWRMTDNVKKLGSKWRTSDVIAIFLKWLSPRPLVMVPSPALRKDNPMGYIPGAVDTPAGKWFHEMMGYQPAKCVLGLTLDRCLQVNFDGLFSGSSHLNTIDSRVVYNTNIDILYRSIKEDGFSSVFVYDDVSHIYYY